MMIILLYYGIFQGTKALLFELLLEQKFVFTSTHILFSCSMDILFVIPFCLFLLYKNIRIHKCHDNFYNHASSFYKEIKKWVDLLFTGAEKRY